jgi:hypothetical protein
MKKSVFLSFCLLFFAAQSFAQQTSAGLRVGYTLSDMLVKEPDGLVVEGNPDFQVDEEYRPLSSFHIGVDGRLQMSERFGLIATLLYARKGYIGRLDWPTGPADATWELHYLNLPVVADFRLWKGLCLQGGMEVSWLLKARVKSAGETFDPQTYSLFEDFDLGAVAGLEYRFQKGFFISARHIFGILPVQEFEVTDDNGASSGEVQSRNSATQFSVGYRHAID